MASPFDIGGRAEPVKGIDLGLDPGRTEAELDIIADKLFTALDDKSINAEEFKTLATEFGFTAPGPMDAIKELLTKGLTEIPPLAEARSEISENIGETFTPVRGTLSRLLTGTGGGIEAPPLEAPPKGIDVKPRGEDVGLIERAGELALNQLKNIAVQGKSASKTAIKQAFSAVRTSILPVPPTDIATIAIAGQIPTTPLEIGLWALGGLEIFPRPGTSRVAKLVRNTKDEIIDISLPKGIQQAVFKPKPLAKGEMATLVILPKGSPGQIFNQLDKQVRIVKSIEQDVMNSLKAGRKITLNQAKMISKAVAESVEDGTFSLTEAAYLLGIQAKKNPALMAKFVEEQASMFGKGLNTWRQIARRLAQHLPADSIAGKQLAKFKPQPGSFVWAMDEFKSLENFRRAMMVAQLGTTSRNIISQTGRYTLAVLEDASSGIFGAITGKTPLVNTFDDAFLSAAAFFGKTDKGIRTLILKELETFPVLQHRLFRTPMHDVAIGGNSRFAKMSELMNTLNTAQETFFRKAAFDAHVQQSIGKLGFTIEEFVKLERDEMGEILSNAVAHALDVTFATNPTNPIAKAILNVYDKVPIIALSGVNPFPRFWANAMKFMFDFSPIGMARLMTPAGRAGLASADPRVSGRVLSRALLGTTMMAAGAALDKAGLTGGKWYEIDIKEKDKKGRPIFADMRGFSPFAFHLFVGKMFNKITEARKAGLPIEDVFASVPEEDYIQAIVNLNRSDATNLPFAGIVRAVFNKEGFGAAVDEMVDLLGRWAGGFTVPGRSVIDIAGQVFPQERTFRDIRVEGVLTRRDEEGARTPATVAKAIGGSLIAPALGNIPGFQALLPERPSPFQGGPNERVFPALRQAGISLVAKPRAELESDSLGLSFKDIFPKAQSRTFNRLIRKNMGEILEKTVPKLLDNVKYQLLPFKVRKMLYKGLIQTARSAGTKLAGKERPELMAADIAGRVDDYIFEILKASGEDISSEKFIQSVIRKVLKKQSRKQKRP